MRLAANARAESLEAYTPFLRVAHWERGFNVGNLGGDSRKLNAKRSKARYESFVYCFSGGSRGTSGT
jgi:hypothetical protein